MARYSPLGISRSDLTGDARTHKKAVEATRPPIRIVVLMGRNVARIPPITAPRGSVPQTMKRIVAFMRPCISRGVIA